MNPETVSILIVEDDDVDARSVNRALKRRGIENPVARARNGREALDILRGENEDYAAQKFIILLDINMPVMNGLEFLAELRDDPVLKSSIIFVLSTSDDERDVTTAYQNFVSGYMLKNRVGNEFVNLVTMLEKFSLMVKLPPLATA